MNQKGFLRLAIVLSLAACGQTANSYRLDAAEPVCKVELTVDRGADVGQSFGSLFEFETRDGRLVLGAGFQNAYNTRYRADRHAIQFFVRPTDGQRRLTADRLPRPNELCGTYLYARDEVVYSTYGLLRGWNPQADRWVDQPEIGGTNETMRVGDGLLEFAESKVTYGGREILSPPSQGSYELFYYAGGHLCFYHVNRRDGPYRPYVNDRDGFSKLIACPWTPDRPIADLSQAVSMTLPIVGETTFAWGQLGNQIVTGSNIGGFYVFADQEWRMLLEPELGVSYQLYSTMSFHDRLLMGQYPTGRIFQYNGKQIEDIAGWPPKLPGVSGSAREAQTTVIYGGELFVGVWPWGELWKYNPDSKQWRFARRMFDYPELSDQITHPYDVQNQSNDVKNLWGQRVTSLVTAGQNLFVSTSAKAPCVWNAQQFPFLGEGKWKAYGSVYRLTVPGHLGATAAWTDGETKFEFRIEREAISIHQDGQLIGSAPIAPDLGRLLASLKSPGPVNWGTGIYGKFGGSSISGSIEIEK